MPGSLSTEERLTDLRNALIRLHKALLDSERASYERDIARVTSTGQLLELVLNDPFFAWLHELSELIVIIDETLDADDPASSEDADRLVARSRLLLVPEESGRGFAGRYFEALQRDPDVVVAHGATVRALSKLGR